MPFIINGLVRRSFQVWGDPLHALNIARIEEFVWPDQAWSGYPLDRLIELADPDPDARYVEVASGDFVAVLPLAQLSSAFLANWLNGQPSRDGWRLVAPGPCYHRVKNVDRVTVVADCGGESAGDLARLRMDAQPSSDGTQATTPDGVIIV